MNRPTKEPWSQTRNQTGLTYFRPIGETLLWKCA